MRDLEVEVRREVEPPLVGRRYRVGDVATAVPPGTRLVDRATGGVLVVFGRFEAPHQEVKRLLPRARFTTKKRLTRYNSGYENVNEPDLHFGHSPQRPVFNNPAAPCKFNDENPEFYNLLAKLGREMMGHYREHSPERFARQEQAASVFHERWRIPGTFFTQGVINDTANLDYHYDRGNLVGCWSCMAVFCRQVSGGALAIPALGARLAIEDETYVLFDGQALLHGVTPIERTGKFGRRFSIVYYAQKAMAQCGTYAEEVEKMRQVDRRKHKKAVAGTPA